MRSCSTARYSGTTRFRDAAIQAADVLVDHIRTGDATHSPWPFRVYGQTDVIREQYTAHVISSIRLFDNLIRLGLGDTASYQNARQTVWNWLMAYPIKNNVWSNYFEDVPIQVGHVEHQPVERRRDRALSDAAYQKAIRTGRRTCGASSLGSKPISARRSTGATRISEQQAFKFPMGSHTSRYASLNAQLYELTGDQTALEKAYRSSQLGELYVRLERRGHRWPGSQPCVVD